MTLTQKSAYDIQCAIDRLDLVDRNLFDVLDVLYEVSDQYKVEWATRAPQIIATYDPKRIRVWYDDATQRVRAVMHG